VATKKAAKGAAPAEANHPAPPTRAVEPSTGAAPTAADGFRDAGNGFALGLVDGKLVCRNPKGKLLAQVPKELKDSETADDLVALRDFLEVHAEECRSTVEGWMARSAETSLALLVAVWPDEAWRRLLENAVVAPLDETKRLDVTRAGFLKAVDETKGLGIVDADGETTWQRAASFVLPHPILLANLDDLRALLAELGLTQGVKQLFREVFVKPRDLSPTVETIETFRGGRFEQLTHARGAAKSLGYRMSGSWVTTRVLEGGRTIEARLWLDGDSPEGEAVIDVLGFADRDGKPIAIADVTPIAFSEGMRMASALYGKRVVEKEGAHD
jgi:hypothetical protein